MSTAPGAPCYVCGADPREPYTPASFPLNALCHCCMETVCEEHSDTDAEIVGDPPGYEGTTVCHNCQQHEEACA